MTNTIVNVFKEVVTFMLFKRFLQRKKTAQWPLPFSRRLQHNFGDKSPIRQIQSISLSMNEVKLPVCDNMVINSYELLFQSTYTEHRTYTRLSESDCSQTAIVWRQVASHHETWYQGASISLFWRPTTRCQSLNGVLFLRSFVLHPVTVVGAFSS